MNLTDEQIEALSKRAAEQSHEKLMEYVRTKNPLIQSSEDVLFETNMNFFDINTEEDTNEKIS